MQCRAKTVTHSNARSALTLILRAHIQFRITLSIFWGRRLFWELLVWPDRKSSPKKRLGSWREEKRLKLTDG